jgi:hypothetical protein
MMTVALVLLASAMPQDPAVAAAEARARTELGHAAQHVDALLLHAGQLRDRAKAAVELARASEATASQVDRTRLAKLAGDLAQQLASLDAAVETHTAAIQALRGAIAVELPPPTAGTAPWFRDRIKAARKLPDFDQTVKAMRAIEADVVAEIAKGRSELGALSGHVRYVLAEAIRETALQARSVSHDARTVSLMRDASKKFDEVLGAPDAGDTGEGSSLHAVALRRRVEIEASLFLAFRALQQQQRSRDSTTANRHRDNANRAFDTLTKVHGDATLPSGQRVVDATMASVDRIREAR